MIRAPVMKELKLSSLQLKCERKYACDKIFQRKLKWYYTNYYVRQEKCFSPVYWRIMSNLGSLKLLVMIRVKISILFDFQLFCDIRKSLYFIHLLCVHRNYYIRDCDTIRILDRPTFVLNLIKYQRRISLLL